MSQQQQFQKNVILVPCADSTIGFAFVLKLKSYLDTRQNLTMRPTVCNVNSEHALQMKQLGLNPVYLDLQNKDDVARQMVGVDTVVMLPLYIEDRFALGERLIDEAHLHGVRRMVMISLVGAHERETKFHRDILGLEHKLQSYTDWNCTILRCSALMDNFLALAGEIKQGRLPLPIAGAKFPPIAAQDVADALLAAITTSRGNTPVIELTGPTAYSGTEMADIFTDILKKNVAYASVPSTEFSNLLQRGGIESSKAHLLAELYNWYSSGKAETVTDGVNKLTEHRATKLTDFITRNITAFQ